MRIELTGNERLQFQYILPVRGSLRTLETVETILQKVKIDEVSDVEVESVKTFEFEDDEIKMIQEMIRFLDQSQQLSLQALTLIRKILNCNGEHTNE